MFFLSELYTEYCLVILINDYSDGQREPPGDQRRALENVPVAARPVRPLQTDVRPGPVGSTPEELQRTQHKKLAKRHTCRRALRKMIVINLL